MTLAAPLVDVGIAVHDDRRPVDRAVRSVLDGTTSPVRVTVVAHNLAERKIADRLGDLVSDPRVRLIGLQDGIRSPAGPFNAALQAADATFTSMMGSDDTLQPGAIDAWLKSARRDRADVVIARLRHASGAPVPTPPTRPGRTRLLHPLRDRLSYRSAPLGLVRRERFPELRFATGLAVGEDVSYVTALWFSGARITYARTSPSYLIHDDAAERTTYSDRSVIDELAFVMRLIESPLFHSLPLSSRRAIAVKVTRIHLFGIILNRPDDEWWTPSQRRGLERVSGAIEQSAPGFARVLSRADRQLLDAVGDCSSEISQLRLLADQRRRFLRPAALIPRGLSNIAAREAPLRMSFASWLQTRG